MAGEMTPWIIRGVAAGFVVCFVLTVVSRL